MKYKTILHEHNYITSSFLSPNTQGVIVILWVRRGTTRSVTRRTDSVIVLQTLLANSKLHLNSDDLIKNYNSLKKIHY